MIMSATTKPKLKAKGYVIDKDGNVKVDTPNGTKRIPLNEYLMTDNSGDTNGRVHTFKSKK